jgi:polyisoprenoid-binding protein YceI
VSVVIDSVKSSHKLYLALLFVLATSGAVPSARATDAVLEINPTQTQINIVLGGNIHTVHGTFKLKHGAVKFDPVTGRASGSIVVDATSGDTGNGMRDHKMHKDVLESEQYPEISFFPESVAGKVLPQGEFKVQVSGTIMLHGAKHPLKLDVEAQLAGNRLSATTAFKIPYESWGMKNPSNFLLHVDDSVDIEIHAVGTLSLAEALH